MSDASEPLPGEEDGEPEVDVAPEDSLSLWSSDSELGLAEARRLTGQRGAQVVMLLGESGVGKTTLLVELWTDLLLHGSLGGVRFGGSATALPFEHRAFQSRMQSGVLTSYTLKTYEDDDGFLHLRVGRPDGVVVELLLSDFAGEHFRRIREGTAIHDELDWTGRVDKFAVVIDAKACVTPGEREIAVTRTERLILALQVSPSVHESSSVRLVVAKDDEAEGEGPRSVVAGVVDRLIAVARAVDSDADVLYVAARPASGAAPYGLDELLCWLARDVVGEPARPSAWAQPKRAFARFV